MRNGWNGLAAAQAVVLVLELCSQAEAVPFIVTNSAAFGGAPIQTFDFATGATVGSFIPSGGSAFGANGRGVLVIGNEVFYTELTCPDPADLVTCGFGPTDFIRVAPFNGGAGGADTRTLPNPRPGTGIQDLAFRGGVLYALTGYPDQPPQVFGLSPTTGAVLIGPVSIAAPAVAISDGFTVLANGNFLINNADGGCTYNQFNPSTGALIAGTTIVVPGGATFCTGVDTDGVSLFFATNDNRMTQTDLTGTLIAQTSVALGPHEDISLLQQVETASVPTLSEWAQILMVGLLVTSALWVLRRRRLA